MGVQRGAPGAEVVAPRRLDERRAVALEPQRRGDAAVVVHVVLPEGARQRHRDRRVEGRVAQDTAYEAHDPPVTREALLHVVVTRDEERRGLQEEPGERARGAALGVQHREAAEARAHAGGRAGDRDGAADRGQDLAGERAGVERRRGVPLVAVPRIEEGDAVRRDAPGPDELRGAGREAGLALVLGPVVDSEQRERDAVADPVRAPERDLDGRAQRTAADRERAGATARGESRRGRATGRRRRCAG